MRAALKRRTFSSFKLFSWLRIAFALLSVAAFWTSVRERVGLNSVSFVCSLNIVTSSKIKLVYRERLVEQPPPVRRNTFDSFDHSLGNVLSECSNSGAIADKLKSLVTVVQRSDETSFIVFKNFLPKIWTIEKWNKKGRACTRPFKSNLLIRCQYIRGQSKEEYRFMQPADCRQTFCPTSDLVQGRKSISGLQRSRAFRRARWQRYVRMHQRRRCRAEWSRSLL